MPHIVEAASENMVKSTRESEFHPCAVFTTGTLLRDGRNAKRQFCALQSKDQLRDLCNYLNQKITTGINTLDGSTLGDNLISSHQVDYVSSVLIPAEAVEKNQEYFLAKGR